MDPMTMMALAQLGVGLMGAFSGGDEQELTSFEGTQLDPVNMGVKSSQLISGMGDVLSKRAGRGVQLRGVGVQTPGGYSGGGLPQPIGLSGRDPAMSSPSMLSRPGVDFGSMFSDINKSFGQDAPQGGRRMSPRGTPTGDTTVPRGQGVPDEAGDGWTRGLNRIKGGRSSTNPITTDPTGSHEEALSAMRRLGFKV